MRKIILASWIITVLSFSGLFVSSVVYDIDAWYTLINFEFEIYDVSIVKNSTGDIVSLRVSANISNPSRVSSFRLLTIRAHVSINNQGLRYVNPQKWFSLDVPPQEKISIMWAYLDLQQNDLGILNKAESDDNWNWTFSITVSLISNLLGTEQFDRSQSFSGVTFILI